MRLRITEFKGLNQSEDELNTALEYAWDARNISVSDGSLRSAGGYRKHTLAALSGGIGTLIGFYQRAAGQPEAKLLAANEAGIYQLSEGTWSAVHTETGSATVSSINYQNAQGEDSVILADGARPVLLWNGAGAMQEVDVPENVRYLTLHYERLWGAGAVASPDSVYWSRAYDPTNWLGDATVPELGGGELSAPTWNGGSIIGLRALWDDVLVFKEDDLFRVVGTYPGDYEVSHVAGVVGPVSARTICASPDACYFLSRDGLCAYTGGGVGRIAGGDKAKAFFARINRAASHRACAALFEGKLYLAVPVDGALVNNAVLEWDMQTGRFVERSGIRADCFLEFDDRLLFANDSGYVYRYGEGDDLDGASASCWWLSPWSELGAPDRLKRLEEVTFLASGAFRVCVETELCTVERSFSLSSEQTVRIRLGASGRRVRLRVSNIDGSAFVVRPGLTIRYSVDE